MNWCELVKLVRLGELVKLDLKFLCEAHKGTSINSFYAFALTGRLIVSH